MKTVGIIYGTSGGNTKLVCQKVAMVLEKKKIKVEMHRVIESTEHVFDDYDYLILASPTYGHGLLDPHVIPFYERAAGMVSLKGKQCAVIGLGDDMYDADYNIESARILREFILDHDGEIMHEPLLINKTPLPHLETRVKDWAERLANKI